MWQVNGAVAWRAFCIAALQVLLEADRRALWSALRLMTQKALGAAVRACACSHVRTHAR